MADHDTRSMTLELTPEACQRAANARDPRFDGIFFIGVTTTRVYCRPVCPARVTYPERRRFFFSAAAAEREGYRPCLRCRPELAPGRAVCDSVSRLASVAAQRIAAGGLNGRRVAELARDLHVSERHLRRAMERELGVSPVDLAQTHRLLLAKRLLADTVLPVTRIAYASGFQSLRRFNSVFRERYRIAPNALRRQQKELAPSAADHQGGDMVRLTLAYRAPLAWDALLAVLRAGAIPGVERIDGRRYGRTVRLDGASGVVFVQDVAPAASLGGAGARRRRARGCHVSVELSSSLVPVLMPLLARLRQLLDLDAEPCVVDRHLRQGGLDELVSRLPGLRVPGVIDGFELALRLLAGGASLRRGAPAATRHVFEQLGDRAAGGVPGLTRLSPTAAQVASAGDAELVRLGMTARRAESAVAVAKLATRGALRLEPAADPVATHRVLTEDAGMHEQLASLIVMRALRWPDALPAGDRLLQRAAGVSGAAELTNIAERWRPWRAYAAMHLWLAARR